jgi:co-chaperonin GroES (HSP10)
MTKSDEGAAQRTIIGTAAEIVGLSKSYMEAAKMLMDGGEPSGDARLGDNPSGLTPLDLRVIIAPDPVQERVGSILLPDAEVERKKWAQTKGTLIAVGENAFREWGDVTKPQPGARIVFAQYAGKTHEGRDGRKYTVANDEDVLAILEEN